MTALIPSAPEFVLELAGLEQRLTDRASGATFTVHVKMPLALPRRSVVALLGPSGCGKTTLLTVLGLLRSPTAPESLEKFVIRTPTVDGIWHEHDLQQYWLLGRRHMVERLRREQIGFALQSGELISSLTVRENIAVPLRLNAWTKALCRSRVDELLATFALEESAVNSAEAGSGAQQARRLLGNQRINRLSGGEYQRVALARAIAHRPALVFVDEPTSALNRELAHDALKQIRSLQCGLDSNGALIMITHDENLASTFADVIVRMAPRRAEPVGEVVDICRNVPTLNREQSPRKASNAAAAPSIDVSDGLAARTAKVGRGSGKAK